MNNWQEKYLNKVTCGDCLELMKELPDKCVDAVVTDIPFNVALNYNSYKDNLSMNEYEKCLHDWFIPMGRVAQRSIIKFPTKYSPLVLSILDATIGYKWTIIQSSPNATSHGAFNLNIYTQYAVSCGEGKTPNYDLFVNTNNTLYSFANHPAQMPVEPIKWIIDAFTRPTDIILDPFLGSGTTAVAAIRTGRQFIGFEIDPKYCEIAERRIRDEQAKIPIPFNEPPQSEQLEIL